MPDFVEPNDHLARSSILRQVSNHRVSFDPSKKAHCESLKSFLETGRWGNVMFYPEYPYTDVPTYVLAKFACHALKVKRKTSAETQLENARRQVTQPVQPVDLADELIEVPQV